MDRSLKHRIKLLLLTLLWLAAASYAVAGELDGRWEGEYTCGQGLTGVTIIFEDRYAKFQFYPVPSNPNVPTGEIQLRVRYRSSDGTLVLKPGKWIDRPKGYDMIEIRGSLSPDKMEYYGKIQSRGCGQLVVRKVEPGTPKVAKRSEATPRKALSEATPPADGSDGLHDPVKPAPVAKFAYTDSEFAALDRSVRGHLIKRANLEGIWEGLSVCRETREKNVSFALKQERQGYRLTSVEDKTANFMLEPSPGIFGLRTTMADKEGSSGPLSYLHSVTEFYPYVSEPRYFSAGTIEPCNGIYVTRFAQISGLSGKYAEWKNFTKACKGIDEWVSVVSKAGGYTYDMKRRAPAAFADFEDRAAAVNALFDDDLARTTFGRTISEMGRDQTTHILQLVTDCYMLREQNSALEPVVDKLLRRKAIEGVKARMHHRSFGDYQAEKVQVGALEATRFEEGSYQAGVHLGKLAELLPLGIEKTQTPAALEARLVAAVPHIAFVSPLLGDKYVGPVLTAVDENRKKLEALERQRRIESAAAERKQKSDAAKALFAAVTIPRALFPKEFSGSIDALTAGELRELTTFDVIFFGAFAEAAAKKCQFDLPPADVQRLVGLVNSARSRAALGAGYSTMDLEAMAKDQSRTVATYVMGAKFGGSIECGAFADAMLRALAGALELNETDEAGDPQAFVRTCSSVHSRSSCICAARIGQAVMPDIHRTPYSPDVLRGVVASNPVLGIQISLTCGIQRY